MSQHYLAMVPWTDEDSAERQMGFGFTDSKIDAIVNGYRFDFRDESGSGFGDGYFNNCIKGNGQGDWLCGNGSGEHYGYCG